MKILEILYKDRQRTAIRYSDGISENWVHAAQKEEWNKFLLENRGGLKKFDGEWFQNKQIIDTNKRTIDTKKFPLYAKIILAIALLFLCSGAIFHYVVVSGETNLLLSNGWFSLELYVAMLLISVVICMFYDPDELKTYKIKRKILCGFSVGIVLFVFVFSFLFLWAFVWHWLFSVSLRS